MHRRPEGAVNASWTGARDGPDSLYLSRLAYYRTSPVFRTDAESHRWLAETVFVGLAREDHGDVCIRFHSVD